jgi:hypothetical protein
MVTESGPSRLQVRAADWWTAINVGLNEVDLRIAQQGTVSYRVRYWRWASFAFGLSAMLALIGIVLLLTVDVRAYIARESFHRLPGLSADQNVLLIWGIVAFCALVWPWLLIQLHKPVLQRLMRRLITEVDGQ